MATTVGSLLIKIGADTAMIKRDMEVIGNVFNKFEKNTKGALVNVRNAMMGLVSIVAVKKLASEIKSVIDTVDKMRDSARILGVTTESLSKLQYAASLSGVSIDDLQNGLQKMTKSIGQAAHGTGKAGDALQQLHLKAKDLINLSPDEQFLQIADALSKVKNSSEQGRLSVEIFSKAGQGLLSLIQEGRGTIEGFGEELESIGGVVGTDFANSCDTANDAIEKFDKSVLGLKMTLVNHLLPALISNIDIMNELVSGKGLIEYERNLNTYRELVEKQEQLISKRKMLEKPGSAGLLKDMFTSSNKEWMGKELEKTNVDIAVNDWNMRQLKKLMEDQEKIFLAKPREKLKPPVIELDETSAEAKKKEDAYEKSIDLMLKKNDEERALIAQADKYYQDSRKFQEQMDKEEGEVAKKTAEDKWKAIIGTQGKMSDEMIESYLSHLRDMGSTEEEIIQARFDVWKRHTDDWKKGMEVGLREFQDSLGTETEQWADITDNAFQSMRNTAGDFASALMWDFDNIGESFRNMLKQMMMDITRTLMQRSVIDPFMRMASGFVGNLFSGSGLESDIFGGMFDTAFGGPTPFHSGGIVPKYHSGGRVPGTGSSLGILQGGEYVIPKLHGGANDTELQSLIKGTSKYGVPIFDPGNFPSGTLSKWDIPQFGIYGEALMKFFGFEAKAGKSFGMPSSYYEKYGLNAEPRFLAQILRGENTLPNFNPRDLTGQLSKLFAGIREPTGSKILDQISSGEAGMMNAKILDAMHAALQSPYLSRTPGAPELPDVMSMNEKWNELWDFISGNLGFTRKHSGGLQADEQMAILQAGEAVIPKRAVSMNRELIDSLISGGGKRFHDGGISGQGQSSSPSITINVENRGSNPVNVTQGPTVISQGRILATMVIDEIRRNPNMRNALR